MDHPDLTALVGYASGTAPAAEAESISRHLFHCTECLETLVGLRRLRRDFAALWESWTAAEHGRLLLRWRIARALLETARGDADLSARAYSWLERLEDDPGITVRLLLAEGAAIAAAVGLPPGFTCEPGRDLSGAEGEAWEKTEESLAEARGLLAGGRWEEARERLRAATESGFMPPRACALRLVRGGETAGWVLVDGRERAVEYSCRPRGVGELPCLLLIMPEGESAPPLGALPRWSPAGGDFRAAFHDLAEGLHTLCIGPVLPRFDVVL